MVRSGVTVAPGVADDVGAPPAGAPDVGTEVGLAGVVPVDVDGASEDGVALVGLADVEERRWGTCSAVARGVSVVAGMTTTGGSGGGRTSR